MAQNKENEFSRMNDDDTTFRQKVFDSFKKSFGTCFAFDCGDSIKVFSRRYDLLGNISTHIIRTIDRSGTPLYSSWQVVFNGINLATSSVNADEAVSQAAIKFHSDPTFVYIHQISKLEAEVDELKQKIAALLNK